MAEATPRLEVGGVRATGEVPIYAAGPHPRSLLASAHQIDSRFDAVVTAIDIVTAVNERDALLARVERLEGACREARNWLAVLGQNSPIGFGGEAELDEQLRAALEDTTYGE